MEKMELIKLDHDENYIMIKADRIIVGNATDDTITRIIRKDDHPVKIVSDGKIEILF